MSLRYADVKTSAAATAISCCNTGKFALAQNPVIYNLLAPLDPLIRLYTTVPFASLIVFFAIYLGIINQRETWPRYVRFNAMQVHEYVPRFWCAA